MKRFRYSMLLFFAAAVFVAVGLISRPLLSGVKQASVRLVQTGDVDTFIDNVGANGEIKYSKTYRILLEYFAQFEK